MNAAGLGVTPELLTGAADEIDAAVRGGDLGGPPVSVAGADYGHPGVADAVAQLADAIRAATQSLVAGASGNAAGLRAGANAYLAQEQAALRAVTREQAGLAELMGVTGPTGPPRPTGASGLTGVPRPTAAPGLTGASGLIDLPGPTGAPAERRAG